MMMIKTNDELMLLLVCLFLSQNAALDADDDG